MKLRVTAKLTTNLPYTILTAAPKVIQKSIFYLRIKGSKSNLRYTDISFYSPSVKKNDDSLETYELEVGDWDKDGNMKGAVVKKALRQLVYPLMRKDVHIDDHEVFDKILRKLSALIFDETIEYFSTPWKEKSAWQKIIKLDISKLLDTKVQLTDPEGETEKVAKVLL